MANCREIGSEFCACETTTFNECFLPREGRQQRFVLSGRTAIDLILSDMAQPVRKVYLPDYCCRTMIEPFAVRGIACEFYHVHFDTALRFDFDTANDCDFIYLIDYFGFPSEAVARFAQQQAQSGKRLLYDATQTALCQPQTAALADYSFYSLRKWSFLNCAVVEKHGSFCTPEPKRIPTEYLYLRKTAARQKAMYLNGEQVDKETFLSLYAEAEKLLEREYRGYAATDEEVQKAQTFDCAAALERRRENAAYLLQNLPRELTPMFPSVREGDCPLHIPILLARQQRDALRAYLTANEVYCPIHWPRSALHPPHPSLSEQALSLVCDQRYQLCDMQRLVTLLKEFFNFE